eukprot:9491593-Pyramimonas_sp.AAC.1
MAQPIGGRLIFGVQGRNLRRNQPEDVLSSAAKGATYGATSRRTSYSRRLRAQPMAQLIGGRSIPGGRGRSLWRNQ